ncbi:MAG: metal ABC transporter solute-binding protein, Zn/Mn family [Brevinematales bacterium]
MKSVVEKVCVLLFFISVVLFAQPLEIFVSIAPQSYLMERIGGTRVHVHIMVPEGKNPHTYEPTPSQLVLLGKATIWFTVGLEFESVLVKKIEKSYPALRFVDTSQGINKRVLSEEEIMEHEHDDHDEDKAGALDPHIWMSLRLAKIQALHIRDALISLDQAGKSLYEANYMALIRELDEVDREISTMLAPCRGRSFFVYHPVLGYFADDYGLRQMAIEIEGKEPSSRVLSKVIQRARKEKIRIIFVQEGFSRRSAEAVARAINGRVEEINPLSADYLAMFQRIAKVLVDVWK